MAFSHLHVRSGFSYGLGVDTPEDLVGAAAGMGMRSMALTDRDGMHGIPRFLRAAGEAGLLAVVGAEITVELRKDGAGRGACGQVVVLADSAAGYRSLCRLVTSYRTSSEDRRRPRCPLDVLLEHAGGSEGGLVCLTGAIPFGLLPRLLLGRDTGPRGKHRELIRLLREAFGPGNLYVELTDDRTAGSRRRLGRVASFAREVGLPTLAAGEVSYLSPADHRLHEVLAAASSLSALPGPGYRPTDRLHLRPPSEAERLFASHPEALVNASSVAERCAGAVRLTGELRLPSPDLPDGGSPEKELLALALSGANRRYRASGEDGWVGRDELKARLRREISCISSMGFAGYFLIAHEAYRIAREKGIPVTGRGSAANSVVSYCLGLTQPEPFANRLLFERFMHEDRKDPPDIDLDLCSKRRDEVRDELIGRYEASGAAVAATASTLSLRGAVRVAARSLGYGPAEIDELASGVPRRAGSWDDALGEPSMRANPMRENREGYALLMDLAVRLRGRLWQAGTHLGGLVFGTLDARLSELVPLEPTGRPGLLRCQYDKDDLEYVGLPKLDLLGLRMHTALAEAGSLVRRRTGKSFDPLSPPPDDPEAYRLIRSGKTVGMFQLESPGQTQLSGRLKPRRFADLVAQISLFRPGPVRGDLVTPYVMRRNAEEPHDDGVPLPELEEILKPTYGVLLFQEQVLEVARAVAGFTLAEGDGLRRAMTKDRGPEAMRPLRREFLSRAEARGVPKGKAAEVFGWMEGFASYGFSAAHAASFAEISYASAYLRAHHPAEFFAGLLNAQPMGFYSPRVLLNEARRAGLGVLAPDIGLSGEGFAVEEDGRALRVGLRYCRGLSADAMGSILAERREKQFSSVADVYRRTAVDRGALANLVRAGFLDAIAPGGERERAGLLRSVGSLAEKRRGRGRRDVPELPHPSGWWSSREDRPSLRSLPSAAVASELERAEREVLGLDLRAHPLSAYRGTLRKLGVVASTQLSRLPHGTRARAAGLLECLQSPPTRSGRPVWFLLVEDEWGLLQATIFADAYEEFGHLLYQANSYLLEGRVEQDRRRGFSFVVRRLVPLAPGLAAAGEKPGGTPDAAERAREAG